MSAQTLNYLTENNLLKHDQLEQSVVAARDEFNQASDALKATETRLAAVREMKKLYMDLQTIMSNEAVILGNRQSKVPDR